MTTATVKLGINEFTLNRETLQKVIDKSNRTGYLAEFGMPKLVAGASVQEVADRYMTFDISRVCAKITNIRLDDDGVTVLGDIVPVGGMEKIVKQKIKKGQTDTLVFAMRTNVKGTRRELITYDLISF